MSGAPWLRKIIAASITEEDCRRDPAKAFHTAFAMGKAALKVRKKMKQKVKKK